MNTFKTFLLAAVCIGAFSMPAAADQYHRNNNAHRPVPAHGHMVKQAPVQSKYYFKQTDERFIRTKIENNYQRNCPPGLAKKHNGCQAPGQAKKYQIGKPLPRNVTYWEVPRDVRAKLHAPPRGAEYVMVDRDVLLISTATRNIIDAIVLFSSVGR